MNRAIVSIHVWVRPVHYSGCGGRGGVSKGRPAGRAKIVVNAHRSPLTGYFASQRGRCCWHHRRKRFGHEVKGVWFSLHARGSSRHYHGRPWDACTQQFIDDIYQSIFGTLRGVNRLEDKRHHRFVCSVRLLHDRSGHDAANTIAPSVRLPKRRVYVHPTHLALLPISRDSALPGRETVKLRMISNMATFISMTASRYPICQKLLT